MPVANHTLVLTYEFCTELELREAIRECMRVLGWHPDSTPEGDFRGTVPISWLSWGETLTVRTSPTGTLVVESRCAFPLQMVDWGKNGKNCETFALALNEQLGRTVKLDPHNSPPITTFGPQFIRRFLS